MDGTSGTLLACDHDGSPLGEALAYSQSCPELQSALQPLVDPGSPAASCSGSLARALRLLTCHGEAILLRHQADWISGWLLNDWRWGEEGNNLRLGWDLITNSWPARFAEQSWRQALPEIRPSGSILGTIAPEQAKALGLENDLIVVAGTTDSNAAVLAADPGPGDGITVLGTTLVMKCFTETPLHAPGVTSHRVGGRWLCGGASNAGAGVLRRFYSDDQLSELSRQINPDTDSGLRLRPLPAPADHQHRRWSAQSPMATAAGTPPRLRCNELPNSPCCRGGATGPTGPGRVRIPASRPTPMPTKLRDGLAIGLFVVLAGYVGFSGIRLGLLLIERFA